MQSRGSPLHSTHHSEASTEETASYFHTAHSFLSNCLTNQNETWVDQRTSQLINFITTDRQGSSEELKEKVTDNSYYNSYQKHQDQQSPKCTEGSNDGRWSTLGMKIRRVVKMGDSNENMLKEEKNSLKRIQTLTGNGKKSCGYWTQACFRIAS